jgi:4-diphosphocytidyl-2-C-methyl-D-erythritol kinase
VSRAPAPAKVNLALVVGPLRDDGKHEVLTVLQRIDLVDRIELEEAQELRVDGFADDTLVGEALRALAGSAGLEPRWRVRIEKRIPVAAGLAGGSADAAAVLRAANEIAGAPFGADRLRAIAAPLGSDVPSQVEPAHAIVSGTGERVEQVALPPIAVVLVPSVHGLSTADVFREAELLGTPRDELRCDELRAVPEMEPWEIAAHLENDLQLAAVSLRPELQITLDEMGGLGALVSGSGPTVFGLFATREGAEEAARRAPGALVTMVAAR